jgi:hypothetical protein
MTWPLSYEASPDPFRGENIAGLQDRTSTRIDGIERPSLESSAFQDARRAAALIPSLLLRVTYRGARAQDAAIYDTPSDAWRWPVPAGFTVSVTAIWPLDGLIFRRMHWIPNEFEREETSR